MAASGYSERIPRVSSNFATRKTKTPSTLSNKSREFCRSSVLILILYISTGLLMWDSVSSIILFAPCDCTTRPYGPIFPTYKYDFAGVTKPFALWPSSIRKILFTMIYQRAMSSSHRRWILRYVTLDFRTWSEKS
jgi:hypothetical protein